MDWGVADEFPEESYGSYIEVDYFETGPTNVKQEIDFSDANMMLFYDLAAFEKNANRPVSCDANLTFCPLRPIAKDN